MDEFIDRKLLEVRAELALQELDDAEARELIITRVFGDPEAEA